MTVCERVFREVKFEMPSSEVKHFVVSRELVDNPPAELKRILADSQRERRVVARQLVDEFARRFQEAHGMKLAFTEQAADILVSEALAAGQSVRDLCAKRFKDFQFGLKLIARNSGRKEFLIDEAAVGSPDQVLSEWVVESYRGARKEE
jgi:hypothetical protein